MYSQDQLMAARQDELPRAAAQDHRVAGAARDRHANGSCSGLTDHGQAEKAGGEQMTGTNAAAMRVGIKRRPRQNSSHRLGLRLWSLLHAQSLLNGPASGADAVAFIEDDYRRLRHNVIPVGGRRGPWFVG
jgi:hypothetical protein